MRFDTCTQCGTARYDGIRVNPICRVCGCPTTRLYGTAQHYVDPSPRVLTLDLLTKWTDSSCNRDALNQKAIEDVQLGFYVAEVYGRKVLHEQPWAEVWGSIQRTYTKWRDG